MDYFFKAVLLFWFWKHDILERSDLKAWHEMVEAHWSEKGPGYLNRNPGREGRDEAWDNYAGLTFASTILSIHFNEPENHFVKDVVDAGVKVGFVLENVDMDNDLVLNSHLKKRKKKWWYAWLGFDITRWKWGSEVCQYKMCLGYMPQPLEYIWFILSRVWQIFSPTKNGTKNTDTNFMAAMGFQAMILKGNDMRSKGKAPRWDSLYKIVEMLYHVWGLVLTWKADGKGLERVMKIYFPNRPAGIKHPNATFAEGVKY